MSRRNKRNNLRQSPPSERKGNGQGRTYQFTEPPPPPPLTDTTRIWITGGPGGPAPEVGGKGSYQGQGTWNQEHPSQPPPEPDNDRKAQAGFGSRGNRLGAGLRSRLLFPDGMRQLIDERARGFTAQISPSSLLERWLVSQIAMGTAQSDLAGDQLLVNTSLAIQRVDTPRWAEDRREYAENLGARISTAPGRIARQLGRSKYGALFLIDQLTSLRESIASNGFLDDAQRECLLDCLGVDHVFRNGSRKVPAAADGPGLALVVEREKLRLTTKVEQELNAQDLHEQAAARLGIVRVYDQETRNLRGVQTRADRRVKWAYKALADVRAGVDPATIIDNETGRPINPVDPDSPTPAPGPEARRAEPPSPPPPPPASPPAAEPATGAAQKIPVPDGLPEELKQMFLLLGEAYSRNPESSWDEPADEAKAAPPG